MRFLADGIPTDDLLFIPLGMIALTPMKMAVSGMYGQAMAMKVSHALTHTLTISRI